MQNTIVSRLSALLALLGSCVTAIAQPIEPGDLVFDRNFGDRGPTNTVYAVHSYDGEVYFGGNFSTVEPKDQNNPDFSSNGLTLWNNSAREWFDASTGLPTGVIVLALEEHLGDFYCAYGTLGNSVRVAKLGSGGTWSDVSSTLFTFDAFTPEGYNLQSSDTYLYLSGYESGYEDCDDTSLARYNGSTWVGLAPFDGVVNVLYSYNSNGTDVLLHGSNAENCISIGTLGSLNTTTNTWQGWETCGNELAIPVVGDAFTEFQGLVYVGGNTTLATACSKASVFFSNSGLTNWTAIGSGPAAHGNASTTPYVGSLQIGSCEWLVLFVNTAQNSGWDDSFGWSYDGSSWKVIGTGTIGNTVVHDSHVVDGWLYMVGSLGFADCGVGPPHVARLRSIADWNADGNVTNADVLPFFIALAANAPIADLNCDGIWNTLDRLIFLNRHAACQ